MALYDTPWGRREMDDQEAKQFLNRGMIRKVEETNSESSTPDSGVVPERAGKNRPASPKE